MLKCLTRQLHVKNADMKRTVCLLAGLSSLLCGLTFANQNTTMETKTLVAYFSATGTTRAVAQQIAELTGADLFEIAPANPYTSSDLNWRNEQSRSSVEMADSKARPAMAQPSIRHPLFGLPHLVGLAPAYHPDLYRADCTERKDHHPLCHIRQQCNKPQRAFPD